jgi:SAM-dependent methyltransferase
VSAPLACPLCGAALDAGYLKLGRRVHTCRSCGHITVPEGVAVGPDGRSIYESPRPVFEQDGNIEYYLDESTTVAARDKAALVGRFCAPGTRLLDAGASYGHFLAVAQERFDACGLEINQAAVEWSIRHFGVRNTVGSVYAPPPGLAGPFGAITCWDIVEHLAEPERALRRCRDLVPTGGWLFLSTPDAGSLVARAMGRHWHYLDPLQHINLFSRGNLESLLRRAGFRPRQWVHLGHSYRVSYVANRLEYLLRDSALRHLARGLQIAVRPIRECHLTLKLWDVMAVAAQAD